ncbi:MAG: CBS domain-containing protein [Anaerolineae bacterium]|nr:CBS domain-containing protein [Anaerolineae bacterium]
MTYLSDLIDKPVSDVSGERVGTVIDLVASVHHSTIPYPVISALLVRSSANHQLLVPFSDVIVFLAPAIPINKAIDQIVPYDPCEDDIFLSRDIWDKQIIDTDGLRVVRVNDVELAQVEGNYYVANVDIGGLGLLRRMGLARVAQKLASRFSRNVPDNVIAWDDVELLQRGDMRLKVPIEKIAELHPADIADLISDLSRSQSDQLLESLDVETLAETLEEVETDFQASLVENIPDEKLADILEEMSPDEAADLLAELPKERSDELLELMEDEASEDVRGLLVYDEDTAGGIMTTDYVSIQANLTTDDAIRTLRETGSEAETIYYVYIVDDDNCLIGVISLKDLIFTSPQTRISDYMHKRVISVTADSSQEEVAQMISKYNLLAVPVVDDENHLLGIVTSDDALDKIIPTAWKKRIPRMYK